MAGGLITSHFRIHNAIQFFESFSETAPTRYYFYIAKSFAWNDEVDPPTPTDTYQETYYNQWRDIMSVKRIQPSDVSHVVKRYDWVSGTVYDEWDDQENLQLYISHTIQEHNYYVLTNENNVYKVIYNNNYGKSTVKPTGTGTSITSTSDGYRWKYMYTISAGEALKFLTPDWMPVKTLQSQDSSAQWTVQDNAANGAIHTILVSNSGSNYLCNSNTFLTVTNATSFVLKDSATNLDGAYAGSALFIRAGTGSGQIRTITNYKGASRVLTVNNAFTTIPDTTSEYYISPRVIVRGDSGRSVGTRVSAYVSNCAGGYINKITVIQNGVDYSQANVSFGSNPLYGSGASAYAIIPPVGGHGSDPVDELRGYNIMINVNLIGSEANTFASNNDFRIIGLMRDPLLADGRTANASVIDQCTRIVVSGVSGDFQADEIITGLSTGAKARNVYFANTNASRTKGIVRVIRETTNGTGGTFLAGETVTGGTTGVTATVVSRIGPALHRNTGFILYTEYREKVERAGDQTENIKLVLKF
jgi:hypothetical protein